MLEGGLEGKKMYERNPHSRHVYAYLSRDELFLTFCGFSFPKRTLKRKPQNRFKLYLVRTLQNLSRLPLVIE